MVQQRQQRNQREQNEQREQNNKNEKREQREEREEKRNNRVSGGAKKTKKSGEKRKLIIGTRLQVYRGDRLKTVGGLYKKDIVMNKWGRLVSRKMSERAAREQRLKKAGFIPKKGVFKLFKKSDGKKKVRKMTRKTSRK